jgi:hypothetical protein
MEVEGMEVVERFQWLESSTTGIDGKDFEAGPERTEENPTEFEMDRYTHTRGDGFCWVGQRSGLVVLTGDYYLENFDD